MNPAAYYYLLCLKGFNIEYDLSDKPLKEKIKRFHEDFIHSLIIIGIEEMKNHKVAVKSRDKNAQKLISLEELFIYIPKQF